MSHLILTFFNDDDKELFPFCKKKCAENFEFECLAEFDSMNKGWSQGWTRALDSASVEPSPGAPLPRGSLSPARWEVSLIGPGAMSAALSALQTFTGWAGVEDERNCPE